MKTKSVPFSWIERWGKRLDVSPYLGGAVEARLALEQIRFKKEPLNTLTKGYKGGIYNGPIFQRNFVDSPEYGVPFLTSSSMMRADLSDLPLLRRKDAESNKLSYLRLSAGTTMISCSGTVGRMVYARPDMEGMWTCQDILKVVPDPERIPSGYLYAFLASKFGVPMITSATYGAIIQHIEPDHIAHLPIPRLGPTIENQIHSKIFCAAQNRSTATEMKKSSIIKLHKILKISDYSGEKTPLSYDCYQIHSRLLKRLDAAFYSQTCVKASDALASYQIVKELGDVSQIFQTPIFKRPHVDSPEHGYPYYSGTELFTYEPRARGYLAKKAEGIKEYLVRPNWLLMQDAGQVGGLIGRVTRVGASLDNSVVSNHLIRIVANGLIDSAYIYSIIYSSCGYRAVIRNAFGSSIPQLEAEHIRKIAIPFPCEKVRREIAEPVIQAWTLEDEAIQFEADAIASVETSIEEAVKWHG